MCNLSLFLFFVDLKYCLWYYQTNRNIVVSINVLKGDMSLVGPRPEREYYIKQIITKAPYYSLIHQVRPGITSWGMVKFGYASTVDEMINRLKYDILYIENVSFIVDLKILFYTIHTVFTGKGI